MNNKLVDSSKNIGKGRKVAKDSQTAWRDIKHNMLKYVTKDEAGRELNLNQPQLIDAEFQYETPEGFEEEKAAPEQNLEVPEISVPTRKSTRRVGISDTERLRILNSERSKVKKEGKAVQCDILSSEPMRPA